MYLSAFHDLLIIELGLRGFFVRIPFIGQAFVCPGSGLSCWDKWQTLQAHGEVPA